MVDFRFSLPRVSLNVFSLFIHSFHPFPCRMKNYCFYSWRALFSCDYSGCTHKIMTNVFSFKLISCCKIFSGMFLFIVPLFPFYTLEHITEFSISWLFFSFAAFAYLCSIAKLNRCCYPFTTISVRFGFAWLFLSVDPLAKTQQMNQICR